jgi:hypothetical protein
MQSGDASIAGPVKANNEVTANSIAHSFSQCRSLVKELAGTCETINLRATPAGMPVPQFAAKSVFSAWHRLMTYRRFQQSFRGQQFS